MKLNEFLVKAKIATYATEGEKNETILEDGAKELTYQEFKFKYRDRYYGFNPLIGQEIVWQNDRIIWSMNYYGRVTSESFPARKVYTFLKKAMRMIKEDRPFRGPTIFKINDLEYMDESTGDINNFSGTERILFKGKEVYRLIYHGGSL